MRPRDDEVIQFDAYLDGLAVQASVDRAGRGRAAVRSPEPSRPPAEPPTHDLDRVVLLLRATLPRFHPSFSFEERLAGTLRSAAQAQGAGRGSALSGASPGALLPFLPVGDEASDHGSTGHGPRVHRRALLGGVLASGLSICLSVAGAMLLSWKRARTGHLERPA